MMRRSFGLPSVAGLVALAACASEPEPAAVAPVAPTAVAPQAPKTIAAKPAPPAPPTLEPREPVPDEAFRAHAPPLAPITEVLDPPARITRLPNGLRVAFFARHGVPVVVTRLVIDRGSLDLGDLGGLQLIEMNEMFRHLGDDAVYNTVSGKLTAVGGSWESGHTRDTVWTAVRAPSGALDTELETLSRGFVHASLTPSEWEARSHEWSHVASAAAITPEHAERLILFGKHPYGYAGEGAVAINQQTAQRVHAELFQPAHATLVVVGDVTPEALDASVLAHFGSWVGWKPLPRATTAPPLVRLPHPAKLSAVRNSASDQRYGSVIARGPAPSSTDLDAFRLAVELIGGAVSSSLYARLRERGDTLQLTATVQVERTATWLELGASYPSGKAVDGVDQVLGAIQSARSGSMTDEDISTAREALLGAFRSHMATDEGAAALYAEAGVQGFEGVRTFPARIAKLTRKDLIRVINTYLKPEQVYVLFVGVSSELDTAPLGLGTPATIIQTP